MFQMTTEFRRLPAVDSVLAEPSLRKLAEQYPHDLLVSVVRLLRMPQYPP